MQEGSEVSTTPAIPAPRAPEPAGSPAPDRTEPAGQPETADPAEPSGQPQPTDPAEPPGQAEATNTAELSGLPKAADPAELSGQAEAANTAELSGQAEAADTAELSSQPDTAAQPTPYGEAESADTDAGTDAAAIAGRPGRRRTRAVWVVALGVLLLVLTVGLVVLRPAPKHAAAPAAAASAEAAPSATAATPYDKAVAALKEQSAALLRGDEQGFLATVASPLRTRYRDMFRSLRGLGVSAFDYQPGYGQKVKDDPTAVLVRADIAYCFGASMCPADGIDWGKPPHIEQALTLKPAGDRYVIAKVGAGPEPDIHQPVPWESGQLVFAQGRRVTLVASPDQAKNLARILPVADAAAAVDDKFAALNGTPQQRYRIYLAGEKQWKTWYKGESDQWAIGVAVPLNKYGTDVMIRLRYLTDPVVLRVTLQHELGHVVTLTGAFRADAGEDTWLSEGIAEYIGWWPKPATGSYRLSSVRWALGGSHRPTSMIPAQPGAKASLRAGDAFYGLSHFAVDCMAHKYGQQKLFDFVKLVLTEDNSYDQAAQDAYGVGFTKVDKACVTWIRQQA